MVASLFRRTFSPKEEKAFAARTDAIGIKKGMKYMEYRKLDLTPGKHVWERKDTRNKIRNK
jgi:hypothetical protein